MPLMMDDEMDELFGDGTGMNLPSQPPSREIHQRLDDLRAGGCCQGIAWSRWGSIASITSSGSTLEFRSLRCHPDDGTWALSEPHTTPNLTSISEGGPLKHVAWSPSGSDLAVIDASGRITIMAVFHSINKPSLSRSCQADVTDDLHGVVGCYWLNVQPNPPGRPTILHGPGIKDGPAYRYESSPATILGPCHPHHLKSAFVCLTTNGILRVLWPQNNQKWCETQSELESIVSSDDLITHAAICPDRNGTLLIAFATTSMQLRVVRALIEWNPMKADRGPQMPPLNPTIRTRHLAGTSWVPDTPSDPLDTSYTQSSMTQLSHLEFLPPTGEKDGNMPPTIVAIRSSVPTSTSHYNQDVHSTIDRWEVVDKPQSIHPAFENLSSRRNSTGERPQPISYLRKVESFTVNKVAIAMESMNHGRIVFFAYSDSSVEYRDRSDMSETFNDSNLERVWHLSQIGLSYSEDEPCLQVALSPTYCSVVQIRNDGKVKWKQLDYRLGSIGTSMEEPLYAAVITALSLSCATAVMRNVNLDDLLATASKHASAQFAYDWLTELSRIYKLQADYSEENHHDALVRNTSIQLCLSIINSLGFKGQFNSRSFSGKLAWLALQLRNSVVLVTMAANISVSGGPGTNEKVSPLEDAEVINSFAGSVRWTLELVAWLVDTLLSLPSTVPATINLRDANELSLPDLLAHLHSTNTISLHFLLSSSIRGYLTAIYRRLQHLDYIARKAIMISNTNPQTPGQGPQSSLSPALKAAYTQIATLTNTTIIRIKTVETLLDSISTLVKSAYASHQPPLASSPQAERARNTLEIKMLFGGSFPDAFKSVIVELFRKDGLLDAMQAELEPARLFFADFTMLEVDEDKGSVERRRAAGLTMDCFRKGWLVNPVKKPGVLTGGEEGGSVVTAAGKQGARWRRCARCAAVMEDVLTQRQALQWLVMQQRRCFCSGYWDTLPLGEMVA